MTTRESDKFMLRLPDGMRQRIKVSAEAHGRSMNAEVVKALEVLYPDPDKPTPKEYALDPLNQLTFSQEKTLVNELLELMRKHGVKGE
jgi:plasmid stability protein